MTPDLEVMLREIFLVILDLPEETDVTELRQISCEKWDSLATASIIAALESEIGIELSGTQRERVSSYQSVLLLIDELHP